MFQPPLTSNVAANTRTVVVAHTTSRYLTRGSNTSGLGATRPTARMGSPRPRINLRTVTVHGGKIKS